MREICQDTLPLTPWMATQTRRLPGLAPVDAGDWLRVDEAYAAQMAYRVELLADKRDAVYQLADAAVPAAKELLELVLTELGSMPGFRILDGVVTCPDGRAVDMSAQEPLVAAALLVQEDLVILQKTADEHRLTGAVLCFPASWSLAEKFGATLGRIHDPVAPYTSEMAGRVQRVFDFIHVDKPVWRANFLLYSNPDLFQPRREDNRRTVDEGPLWARVERQCLLRLPTTRAVVFSIHSYVVPIDLLRPEERRKLIELRG